MTTTPRSPTPKRRAATWLLRAVLLGSLGGAAYYAFQIADDLVIERLAAQEGATRIEIIEVPQPPTTRNGSSEGPGNGRIRRSAFALDSLPSIAAKVTQTGWLDGEPVATTGEYRQLGGGPERSFLLQQTGELAGVPTRLLRVSDSRFLWTDLVWGTDRDRPDRSVTKINLRRVRRVLEDQSKERPGTALQSDPSAWSRFGGLPMLLSGLDRAFTFGAPRRMQLRGETVQAMVGRWRPERLAELAPDGAPPPRAPQHVVVALSEATLFPRLLEYRDYRDPLSRPGLADNDLLRPSTRPLLKIELESLPDAEPLTPRMFAYRPNDERWSDQTERELRLLKRRRAAPELAQVPTSGGQPR